MSRDEAIQAAITDPKFVARFWAKVDKTPGCWLWTRALQTSGYGFVRVGKGGMMLAHRLAWILEYGPIPRNKDGQELNVLHDCPDGDNPRCVNPAHMFLGTHITNMRDRGRKGRHRVGTESGRAALTAGQVRDLRNTTDSDRAAGARHGVSASVAWSVRNRKTYLDVP